MIIIRFRDFSSSDGFTIPGIRFFNLEFAYNLLVLGFTALNEILFFYFTEIKLFLVVVSLNYELTLPLTTGIFEW